MLYDGMTHISVRCRANNRPAISPVLKRQTYRCLIFIFFLQQTYPRQLLPGILL